ncbi:MAG: RRXRR domain-containing protein, partial [Candidatus Hodarchaeales archaeon]
MALRIPVISVEGHPLMPTTPAKARKLLRNGAAKGHYNKLGMFCLRLCTSVGPHIQALKLAIDYGSKYDGYAVGGLREVCLTAMAKMPTRIAKKMTDRGRLRRTRRYRLWQRPKRFTNRKQQTGWLAPSQHAKVVFRRKIVTELARTFPL